VGRETFHSGSRNYFNLDFKFAIVIRQNKRNRLQFYALSFIQFCARKLLLSILVLRLIFHCEAFSTKLHAHKMSGAREFRTIFKVTPKSITHPWVRKQNWLRKKHSAFKTISELVAIVCPSQELWQRHRADLQGGTRVGLLSAFLHRKNCIHTYSFIYRVLL